MNANEARRRARLVFVDPEDESALYWWPAIIVPEEEFEMFHETMDSDISAVAPGERLVCYFEDGSFSVVPESAMVPFCPGREPFQSYTRHVRRFTSDLGVSRAVRYWQAGIIPEGFKWLRASAKKRMDVEEEEEEEEGQEKEKGEEGKGKEERDGQSERREDHSRVTEEEEIVIETTPIRKRAITANGSFSGGKGKNTTCKKTSTSPTMPRTKPRSKRVEKPSSGGATTHSGNGGGTGAPSIICLPSYKEPRKFYLLASLLPVALPR